MRIRADQLAPDPVGVLKDRSLFFRQGKTGTGGQLLSTNEYAHYRYRTAQMAPPDLLGWLHRES